MKILDGLQCLQLIELVQNQCKSFHRRYDDCIDRTDKIRTLKNRFPLGQALNSITFVDEDILLG